MIEVKQKIIDLVKTFGYGEPSLQGSFPDGENLPDSFFTYWNYESNLRFSSNNITSTEYVFRIFFYSTNIILANSVLAKVRTLLMKNNFHCSGDYDIESGEASYYAREMEVRYLKTNKEEN